VRVLREVGVENVGGPFVTTPRNNSPLARAIAAVASHRFGVGDAHYRTSDKPAFTDTVPFGCFPKEIFGRLGLFDERLQRGQDYEFNQRIRKAGGKILFDPSLRVTYFIQSDWRTFVAQSWKNGLWNPFMHYLHPYTLRARHLVPGLFAADLVAAAGAGALSLVLPPVGLPWLAVAGTPLVLYAVLNALASLQAAERHGWDLLPWLPWLFLSLHSAYGFGVLWGWARVLRRDFPWAAGGGIPKE
jgi:hypothetical protein